MGCIVLVGPKKVPSYVTPGSNVEKPLDGTRSHVRSYKSLSSPDTSEDGHGVSKIKNIDLKLIQSVDSQHPTLEGFSLHSSSLKTVVSSVYTKLILESPSILSIGKYL